MSSVIVQQGQTLKDLAIQEYGCFEGYFRLLQLNSIAAGEVLVAGTELVIDDTIPQLSADNLAILKQIKTNNLVVNSTYTPTVSILEFFNNVFFNTSFFN